MDAYETNICTCLNIFYCKLTNISFIFKRAFSLKKRLTVSAQIC